MAWTKEPGSAILFVWAGTPCVIIVGAFTGPADFPAEIRRMDAPSSEDIRNTHYPGGGIFLNQEWKIVNKSLLRARKWKVAIALSIISVLMFTDLPCIAAEESVQTSESVPSDFQLPDLDGTLITLSQFKGQKPVLLYFWATWCRYCASVRPAVIELRNATPASDIEVLGINVGGADSLARIKHFEKNNPTPYTILYDTDSKVTHSYQIHGIPYFMLIDKAGEIKYRGNRLPRNVMKLLE
jgi:peroxiredoxin